MSFVTAESGHEGMRADTFLALCGGMSRTQAARLLADGFVLLKNRPVGKNYRVCDGDCFQVTLPEAVPLRAQAQAIPLEVVYEDSDLIVVNKARGMVVHPAPGHSDGTLVNALLHHCAGSLSGIGGVTRPGIVHRLDKDTSGLIMAAKNDDSHTALSAALKQRQISRVYEAVIKGHPKSDAFSVDAPIGRHPTARKKMAIVPTGRAAVTHVTVLAEYPGYSHVRCKLETGRTHQIRVHLAHRGHPLLGDTLYGAGPNPFGIAGQCLHARFLEFPHPCSGAIISLATELPEYFCGILEKISKAQ